MLYDKERLDAAYAKVGLFADSAWAVNDVDGYYRANQNLWRQTCALKDPCEKIGMPRSVLDTIPESRLAEYGTYLYDEQREKQYWGEYERTSYAAQGDSKTISQTQTKNEDKWFSDHVEKIFTILTNPYTKTSDLEQRCLEVIYGPNFIRQHLAIEYCTGENLLTEAQNFNDEFRRNAFKDPMQEDVRYPPPRGTAKTFSELVLQMQLHSEEIRSLWERHSQQSLNVNVPEFYPKYCTDLYCPNINNENQPVCEYETVLVPSLVPWLNYGYPLRALDFREINFLASEFQNLLMYDKSQSASQTNFQQPSPTATASSSLESLQQPQQQQQQQPQQQQQQQQQQQNNQQQTAIGCFQIQEQQSNANNVPTRRLYSAVLQNQTSDTNLNQTMNKSSSVDEFEELEREAIEQYRPSTESLKRASTDSIISAKYQELERLALEQYNSASATDTSAGGQGNECTPLHEPPCGGKLSPYAALLLANSVLVGFYRSVVNTRLLTNLYSNVSRFR